MAPFDTAAGYVIREVFVDEVAQGLVPAYTFYAVDADHTIRAEFLNTGINDLPDELIAVYPNPTNGMVTISSSKFQVSSIAIYDVYGKLVSTYQPTDAGRDVARNVSTTLFSTMPSDGSLSDG